jgi:hypothetical protein
MIFVQGDLTGISSTIRGRDALQNSCSTAPGKGLMRQEIGDRRPMQAAPVEAWTSRAVTADT